MFGPPPHIIYGHGLLSDPSCRDLYGRDKDSNQGLGYSIFRVVSGEPLFDVGQNAGARSYFSGWRS